MNQLADVDIVKLLLKALSSVHEVLDLVGFDQLGFVSCQHVFVLQVELMDFEYELTDRELELMLNCLRQVQAHVVPEGDSFWVAFFNACEVVVVLEEKYLPELVRSQVDVPEQWVLVDCLRDEVDVSHGLLKVSLVRFNKESLEVAVNDDASKLLEFVKEFVEALLHQLLDKTMKQWVVHLCLGRRGQPPVEVREKAVSVNICTSFDVHEPHATEFLKLLKRCLTGHELIKICIEVIECSLLPVLLLLLSLSDACVLELLKELGLEDRVKSQIAELYLDDVRSVEAGLVEFWVFDLFLDLDAAVPVFVAT